MCCRHFSINIVQSQTTKQTEETDEKWPRWRMRKNEKENNNTRPLKHTEYKNSGITSTRKSSNAFQLKHFHSRMFSFDKTRIVFVVVVRRIKLSRGEHVNGLANRLTQIMKANMYICFMKRSRLMAHNTFVSLS